MKIIYLHQYFNTPTMSGSIRSYEFARRLAAAGHEVHMVTSDRRAGLTGGFWSVTEVAGFTVHWYPAPYSNEMSYSRRIRAFCQFAWAAMKKAVELQGDVVYASSTPLTIAIPGIYAAWRNRIPMVLEVRDLWPEAPIKLGALKNPISIALARWLEDRAYRASARIVALAPRLKEGVTAKQYPAEQVEVIPNGCDFDLFDVPGAAGQTYRRKHAWLQDRPLVVYTGTIGLVNGIEYLVRLAAALRTIAPQICIAVAGSGCQLERIAALADELGVLNQNFHLLGQLPKEELPALLSACDLATSFCLNLKELSADSANKFFDALAAGRPIAINHGGWLADLIGEREMGLVLEPDDPRQAAEVIATSLRDKAWAIRAGQAARAAGQDLFDRGILAARLEQVLREAVGDLKPNILTQYRAA